jgi:cytochrome c oxidase subunit III
MTHENDVQRADGRIGMWLFISTEALLFGGLFLLYSMYRMKNPQEFHAASMELSLFFGTLNTCILITSSLSAAIAILSLKQNKILISKIFLVATISLAFGFLIVKTFEWTAKFEHGLYPGAAYLLSRPRGEILYFGLYFMMTGLHAVHVIAGIGILSFIFNWIVKGKINKDKSIIFENAGLYWHLVDVIWIFLFPLFYLIS